MAQPGGENSENIAPYYNMYAPGTPGHYMSAYYGYPPGTMPCAPYVDLRHGGDGGSGKIALGPNGKPKRRRVVTPSQRKAANLRERRRMVNLNEAFDGLRKTVPTFAYEKRLSRIETLRLAITYISFMQDVIDGKDPKDVELVPHKMKEDDDDDDEEDERRGCENEENCEKSPRDDTSVLSDS